MGYIHSEQDLRGGGGRSIEAVSGIVCPPNTGRDDI